MADGAMEDGGELGRLLKRFARAKAEHQRWHQLWQECYDYALPARVGFWSTATAGQKLTDKMFDMTAAVSLQEFASRLQAGMTPTFARWSKLVPGRMIAETERAQAAKALEEITEAVYSTIHRSNFDSQIHEAYLDLGVGTGSLICDEDERDLVRFCAVPLTEVCLDCGPYDSLDGRFRYREMTVRELRQTWKKATLPHALSSLAESTLNRKVKVIEATVRDWSAAEETHRYSVVVESPKHLAFTTSYTGAGSCPWINFRWSKAAGETYGRGPLLLALPDVKVANLVVELVLENAELAIAGLWQADDDGVINPDTVTLTPGTIIPVAQNSRGLQPLQPPGKFDVSQLILENLRGNIKRALYDEMLGPPTGTPMSATEVSERTADLYRRIGSAYGRLQQELVQPVVRRVLYVLRKRGLVKMPSLGHGAVEVHSVSPLASAQAQEDVLKFQQFAAMIAGTFGPQMMTMLIKPGPTTEWLARQQGVRSDLLYSETEQQQLLAQMQSMAAGMSGAPNAA